MTKEKKEKKYFLGHCCCRTCSGRARTRGKGAEKKKETGKKQGYRQKELLYTTHTGHFVWRQQDQQDQQQQQQQQQEQQQQQLLLKVVRFGWATRYFDLKYIFYLPDCAPTLKIKNVTEYKLRRFFLLYFNRF